MPTLRFQNNAIGRLLFSQVFDRLKAFAQKHTPEVDSETLADFYTRRVLNGDENLHVLLTLDDNSKIVGHMVVEVCVFGADKILSCHQAQSDKGNTVSLSEGVEYTDNLAKQLGARTAMVTFPKPSRVLEEKLGFTRSKFIYVKTYKNESNAHEE